MDILTFPFEVLAFVEGSWCKVIGVAPANGAVLCEVNGQPKLFSGEDSFKWDLLWPNPNSL